MSECAHKWDDDLDYCLNGCGIKKDDFAIQYLREQNKIMREALESISKTDISENAPDHIWLNKWRNDTKEIARQALKKIEEMSNETQRS